MVLSMKYEVMAKAYTSLVTRQACPCTSKNLSQMEEIQHHVDLLSTNIISFTELLHWYSLAYCYHHDHLRLFKVAGGQIPLTILSLQAGIWSTVFISKLLIKFQFTAVTTNGHSFLIPFVIGIISSSPIIHFPSNYWFFIYQHFPCCYITKVTDPRYTLQL